MATAKKLNADDPAVMRVMERLQEIQELTRVKTAQDVAREEVFAALDRLGGRLVGEDTILYQGDKFVLPETMEGNLDTAITFLGQLRDAEEEEYSFSRSYPYRPWDGAAAFQRAMTRVFGSQGVGKAKMSFFFGKQPPRYISIPVSHDSNLQVPWGTVRFAPLNAEFEIGYTVESDEEGPIFQLEVTVPRKHRRRIEGFLEVVRDELDKRSIYRGRAIDASAPNPGFIDPFKVDPARVVYSEEANTQLQANLWGVIDNAPYLREKKVPLKRAVLLEGPYGSGKTLAGALTAQHAVQAGWTFILVRGGDDPYAALRTARLYAPSVVWIEDLDVMSAGKTRSEISKLLDALDNASGKGAEVIAGFTTNFAHTIERGVLRPGRIDAVIHVGSLDADGYERVVRATVPADLLAADVDYAAVAEAFAGYLPAFAVEAAHRAIRYNVVRNPGRPGKVTTQDLVDAANGLRPQFKLVEGAGEAAHAQPSIDSLVLGTVEGVLRRTEVDGMQVTVNPSKNGS